MMRLHCNCGRMLGFEPRHLGKKVRCPGCGLVLILPADRALGVEEVGQAERPADPAGRPDSGPGEQGEVGEEGRRKKRVAEESPIGSLHAAGAVLFTGPAVAVLCVMAAIGIGLCVYGSSEARLSWNAGQQPQRINCEQLIASGMPDNPHVVVTDFLAGVCITRVRVTNAEKQSGSTIDKQWESVCIPLMPLTPELRTRRARQEPFAVKPADNRIRLVLLSHKVKNDTELQAVFASGPIEGMIVNAVRQLDTSTENKLREAYPGVTIDGPLILEPGRRPTGRPAIAAMLAGGASLVAVALLLGAVAVVYRPRA